MSRLYCWWSGARWPRKFPATPSIRILEAQNAQRWAEDDQTVEARLAEIREANGGKRPNIVYILLDDIGYGEIGTPDLTPSRGYSTPHIDALSKQG